MKRTQNKYGKYTVTAQLHQNTFVIHVEGCGKKWRKKRNYKFDANIDARRVVANLLVDGTEFLSQTRKLNQFTFICRDPL